MIRGGHSVGRLAICLFWLGVIVGCPGDVSEQTVTISGTVSSHSTQAPIASAWVALSDSLEGIRVETDSTGSFGFAAPPWSEHLLIIGATGYHTRDTTLRKADDDLEDVLVELTASP
jgi:hypothetical protein